MNLSIVVSMVDFLSEKIASKTEKFTKTRIGKFFLSLVLVGPFTFIPTLYQACTAEDIDALRTSTWPLMIVVNMSALWGVIIKGNWQMRLVMFIWVIVMMLIWFIVLVR